jgi:transcriptional regulator with XRE-family HTH domain
MNRTAKRPPHVLDMAARKQRPAGNSLPDYVRRLRHERNFSLAEVSVRSGGRIGKTHINRIENGLVSSVSLAKLRALAKGLGVPEDELVSVALGKFPRTESKADEVKLLNYFRHLSAAQQKDVLRMLRALVDDHHEKGPVQAS